MGGSEWWEECGWVEWSGVECGGWLGVGCCVDGVDHTRVEWSVVMYVCGGWVEWNVRGGLFGCRSFGHTEVQREGGRDGVGGVYFFQLGWLFT